MLALWQDPADVAAKIQTEETFLFQNLPDTWVIGLIIVPAILLFAFWSYGGLTRLERGTRITLSTLRGIALALVVLMLFQPAVERVRYTEVQSQIHVVVDDSASMQRRDTYPEEAQRAALEDTAGVQDVATRTRAQLVRSVLERPDGLLSKLGETYDVRLFRFQRKPLPVRDLGELTSRAPRTRIGDALDLHLGTAGAANLDAMILVSDGRNNSGLDPIEVAQKYRAADTAIYTIGVGDPNPPKNVRIIGPPGPQDALRLEEVVFEVVLDAEGLDGRSVTVTMHGSRDQGPYRPLATADATLGEDHAAIKVRLYHSFEDAGDWTLRFDVTQLPEETSHEDNRVVRFLRVDDEKIRVLFIDDLPRWEYRYIKNALLRVDPSIEAQVFLFDASGSFPQEHSDHLPALRRIPRTKEQLFEYHVILIGDVPPERLAPTEDQLNDWLELLVEFVEFGGGVGFLYGDNAMPERYRGTPLEDLLPVALEDTSDLRSMMPRRDIGFRPRLETPSQPHDIMLLKRDPDNNRELWHNGFRDLVVYYPVQQAKAGATVLLRHPEHRNRYGRRIIAATSFFPRGHTLFIGTDETWRWRDPYGEKYYDSFWRNVVRHLASGRLSRRDDLVELTVDKVTVETGTDVQLGLRVLDEEFQPAVVDQYPVFLRAADGDPKKLLLRPVTGELGSYQGRATMDEPGSFSFIVFANDNPSDEVLGRQDVIVQIPDRERADSSQDRTTLEQIASQSKGGRYVFLADADDLVEDLSGRRSSETEVDRSTRPLWDNMWTLLALLGVLSVEWILRKRARLV